MSPYLATEADASSPAPPEIPGVVRAVLGVRLFWKVLAANAFIVVAAACASGVLAARAAAVGPAASPIELTLGIAAGALALTLAINGAIVWIALRPVHALETTAVRVAEGDLEARVPESPLADRDLERLTHTFNGMLDSLGLYRRRLREIAARALSAAEEERKRVARELHDETAQTLAGLLIRLRLVRSTSDEDVRQKVLEEVREELSVAVERVRAFAIGLRPPALDMLGLVPAIRSHAASVASGSGIEIQVEADASQGRLREEAELAVYRIVQAALSNVAFHSGAKHAKVIVRRTDDRLRIVVRDDGRGFRVAEVLETTDRGLGLAGMQERAAYLSGRVEFHSEPGHGTRVEVEIPIEETMAHAG